MEKSEEKYKKVLNGKQIPIVTLDHKWHRIFTHVEKTPEIMQLEQELNELLKQQGKCNTESKDIKKLKKKLMDEIVTSMEQDNQETTDKVDENKRLINECNEKLDAFQDTLLELPKEITDKNYEIMLATMEICYDALHANEKDIEDISDWLVNIRIELKKKVVKKQQMEIANFELYSYMHDLFGVDVINLFDMKYDPLKNPITKKGEKTADPKK